MENYVITISRRFGSMGHEIAGRMGEMLEIPVYDRSAVEARFQNLGGLEREKKKEERKAVREKAEKPAKPERLERPGIILPFGGGKERQSSRKRLEHLHERDHEDHEHESGRAVSKERKPALPFHFLFEKKAQQEKADAEAAEMFEAQARVIRSLAEEGSCIILGRCGDQIFHGKERCLNIFIYAPVEARIRNCIDLLHTSPEAAESLIETEDRVRDAYRRRFCPDMKDEFDGRHLCIDSSRLGLEESVKLCVEAARYLFYPGES